MDPKRAFKLDHAALERIFSAARIPLTEHGLVLFAFRGCLPETSLSGWTASARLRLAPLDYVHMRCTLGIWDRKGKRFFAAAGSTVPFKDHVEKSAARKGRYKGRGTNQMEPGYYTDLTKGEHLQGKRNGHEALRQTAYRFYRRSLNGVPYRETSPLYYGNPYDNLHCGWNRDGKEEGFASAGCMVVAGIPYAKRREAPEPNQGPWKIFFDLFHAAPQQSFPILLIPGETAAMAAEARSGSKAYLVFGSKGEEVKALQKRLHEKGGYRGRVTGELDARTYRAWKAPRGRA